MHTLTMTEQFPASVDRVFGAWTSATEVSRWFAPGEMHVPEADVDCRPGGRYRIVMEDTDGLVAGAGAPALRENQGRIRARLGRNECRARRRVKRKIASAEASS